MGLLVKSMRKVFSELGVRKLTTFSALILFGVVLYIFHGPCISYYFGCECDSSIAESMRFGLSCGFYIIKLECLGFGVAMIQIFFSNSKRRSMMPRNAQAIS